MTVQKPSGEEMLFTLRQQYNAIPVPEELNGRLLQLTRTRHTNSHGAGRILLRILATAAAVVLAFGIAVNVSPTVARAMADIPVIGSIAKFLTFRTYADYQHGVEADIIIPQIDGLANTAAEQNLNDAINVYINELIAQHEQHVLENPDASEEGKSAHINLQNICDVVTDDDSAFSICITTDLSMASAEETVKHFNLDKRSGKLLTLGSLFKDSTYLDVLTDLVSAQAHSRMAADTSLCYFTEYLSITAAQDFCIRPDHQLELFFDEYSVAPGCMGVVSFIIPTADIMDILNTDLID
ncbi:MAG: DUF3298 domain-containing protein [Clostridia bacterium]